MFCSNCGKKIIGDERFCTQCGKPLTPGPAAKSNGPKIAVIAVVTACLICLAAVAFIMLINGGKPPKEILIGNKWYEEPDVNCEYNDWSSIGKGEGYWFHALCDQTVFYSYGEAETVTYKIGGWGTVYGPFPYEITADNIPSHLEWEKHHKVYEMTWEILEDNTLKCDGDYYLWDQNGETHCNCDDSDCRHEKTWFVTGEYLRIGDSDTLVSKKPSSLRIDD